MQIAIVVVLAAACCAHGQPLHGLRDLLTADENHNQKLPVSTEHLREAPQDSQEQLNSNYNNIRKQTESKNYQEEVQDSIRRPRYKTRSPVPKTLETSTRKVVRKVPCVGERPCATAQYYEFVLLQPDGARDSYDR